MAKKRSSRTRRSRQSPSRKVSRKRTRTSKKAATTRGKSARKKKVKVKKVRGKTKVKAPTVVVAATEAGCLDQEVATALVFGCIPGAVPLSTPLGTLFPSDVVRRGFCGCVFNTAREAGSTIGPTDVPCTPSTSVGDVIDAISC